jgi:hypothetical protein
LCFFGISTKKEELISLNNDEKLRGALSAGTTTYLLWRNDRCFVTFGSLKIDVVRVLTTGHNIMQPRKNIYTTYPFFLTKIQMNKYVVVPADNAPNNAIFICRSHYIDFLHWNWVFSIPYITTGVKLF